MSDWIGLAYKHWRNRQAAYALNLGIAASEPVNEDAKMFAEGLVDKTMREAAAADLLNFATRTPRPRGIYAKTLKSMRKIRVPIRENATGEVRFYEYECEEQSLDGQEFWWSEGNASCDCNREIFFRSVNGDSADGRECGNDAFTVEYIEFEDGTRVIIDGPAHDEQALQDSDTR